MVLYFVTKRIKIKMSRTETIQTVTWFLPLYKTKRCLQLQTPPFIITLLLLIRAQ
jgi:hypothetical protein